MAQYADPSGQTGGLDQTTPGRYNPFTQQMTPGTVQQSGAAAPSGGSAASTNPDPNYGAVSLGPSALMWLSSPAGQQFLQQNQATVDQYGHVVDIPNAQGQGGFMGTGQMVPLNTMHDPNAAAAQQWNPLAVNMFYSTAIAPMLQSLGQQFQGQNQQFMNMAQNAPGQQYLSPSEKAMSQQLMASAAQGNNNVAQAALQAALTGPVIDQLSNQMSTLSQRALQSYTEALRQGASTDLSSIFAPSAAGTNTSNAAANALTQLVSGATQPSG